MDNTEEIYKFVGKLVLEAHLQTVAYNAKIKELYTLNSQLEEQIRIIQELKGNEQ